MIRLEVVVKPGYVNLDKALMRRTLRAAGTEVAAVARTVIRTSTPTGKVYGTHRASAPGQAPANQTGNLASHFKVRVHLYGDGVRVVATAQSRSGRNAPHGLFLEAGARGGVSSWHRGVRGKSNRSRRGRSRFLTVGIRVVEPRPFLTTALQMRSATLTRRITESVHSGMKFVREKP